MAVTRSERRVTVRGVLVGDQRPSDVLVDERGIVTDIRPAGRSAADIGSSKAIIGPTLFDIQVNGAFGIDLQSDRLRVEDVARLNELLAAQGVSRWMPTLITGPASGIERRCRLFAEALEDKTLARAVPGIHLEGPYISPEDGPRGAHARKYVRKPDLQEFDRFLKASKGAIRCVTVAPEIEGAVPFIRALVRRGLIVALGHHAATADQIARAVDSGARLCTHLGNGMASQVHRHHNPLWPQLADDRLIASLIADLEHLPAPVLKSFVRCKGPDRVIITSDVVHIAGLPPGTYSLMGVPVELKRTGRICLSGTDLLAGSSLMLLQGVVNAAWAADLTLAQAFACAGQIPSRLFGLRTGHDLPRPQTRADFIVFEIRNHSKGPRVRLLASFINGTRVDP